MKLFGLIGFPLSHSFSQKYFTKKFLDEGIAYCKYQLFEIENIDELKNIIQNNPNLKGINITIPHKQNVLPFLTDSSHLPIAACNCIKFDNGKIIGYNTDVVGFEESLKPLLGKHHSHALVLGTGGAAIAVQYVLTKLNIQFLSVSRNKNNGITYQDLTKEIIHSHTLIINTTPLGTYPNVDECPNIPYQFITQKHYCYDLVYNPAKTKFLALADAQGASIKNGADMLQIQAEESWKIWNW